MVEKEQGCLQDSGGPSYWRWSGAGAKAKSLPGRVVKAPRQGARGKTGLSTSTLSTQELKN